MVFVQNVFIDTECAKSCLTKLTFQGTTTVFTANQQQIMTVKGYRNCSNFCPPYSVLSTDQNKKLNTTGNDQSSLLHCLGKGTFRTHCIIFQAGFGRIFDGLVCLLFCDFVWSAFWDSSVTICHKVNRKCLDDSVALWTATEENYTNVKKKKPSAVAKLANKYNFE